MGIVFQRQHPCVAAVAFLAIVTLGASALQAEKIPTVKKAVETTVEKPAEAKYVKQIGGLCSVYTAAPAPVVRILGTRQEPSQSSSGAVSASATSSAASNTATLPVHPSYRQARQAPVYQALY